MGERKTKDAVLGLYKGNHERDLTTGGDDIEDQGRWGVKIGQMEAYGERGRPKMQWLASMF